MGKKKSFVDKKNAQRFRLFPASSAAADVQEHTEEFTPDKAHIAEQHRWGIFYDDNYDYTQHLRDRGEKSVILSMEEQREVVRALPVVNETPVKRVVFDDDVDRALEGEIQEESGDLEDNFIELAGGVVEDRLLLPRVPRLPMGEEDSDYDEDEDDEDFDDFPDADGMEDESEEEDEVGHDANRQVDDAFDAMLEANYNEDQLGELDNEALDIAGGLEPTDGRVRSLVGEKRGLPQYDEMMAKKYVRDRMKYLEKHGEKHEEMEEVEVDESARKRAKWDCESFATQYTSIYNHPSIIKEKLSKKALRRLEAASVVEEEEEEEDEDMEEVDDESVCTTATTIRRRGETTEERKLRKTAVKEARRVRRAEKKENKEAFALEHRKVVAARVGRIKATPIV